MINNKISETKLDKLFDLKNKKIIVTGSNSGIGLQLSRSLTKLGAKIIRIDKIFNTKLQTDDYICDLRSYNQIVNTFKKIKRNFKKISGLVNCAGVSINSNMPYEDINYYDETLNVNLKSAFIVSTEACKIMKKIVQL